jgi:RNA polymerase sigma-70 factor (ECF subfamily)
VNEVPPDSDRADAPPADPADTVLVARAQRGDVEAYEELVRRHQRRIYALVYNMTSHKEDAEDLVQDVFIKGFSALPHFKGQSSFYTWIYRIAINRVINFLKKRKRRMALSLNDLDSGAEREVDLLLSGQSSAPRQETDRHELQERLNVALQKLSEKHRTVVVMHDIQGIPHDTIAETLGVSPGTVRSRLFYARQLLQSELSDLFHERKP